MFIRPALLALALTGAAAVTAGAQQWRTVDVSRQLRDTGAHDVRIRYGAGSLEVRPASEPVLFAMQMKYDEESVTPVHRYDAADRSLTLGLSDPQVKFGRDMGRRTKGEMRVALSPRVPVSLDLEVGAAQTRLDLGGLTLRDVKIETGASDSRVTFDTPNRTRMHRLDVTAGAANLALERVANARVGQIHVKGGVGNVSLDLAGNLTEDVDVEVEMALGRVAITVPRGAGVRVELERFISGFDHFGLEKRGDAWYSENWDRAERRVRVRVQTAFGSVAIHRAP